MSGLVVTLVLVGRVLVRVLYVTVGCSACSQILDGSCKLERFFMSYDIYIDTGNRLESM
jgi:hypothetical protein